MYINRIESSKGKRYKVFGNDEFLFSLYGGELKRYQITEDMEIADAVVGSILEKVILKRAKERALYLLERKPFSVSMLKEKLRYNDYPETVIEQVVSFLEKYHYLNDREYIRMYVNSYSNKKSRKRIIYDLLQKGIAKQIIEDFFETVSYSERECFERQFERYICGKNLEDFQVRQKVFRYFYGKGFQISLINEFLKSRKAY